MSAEFRGTSSLFRLVAHSRPRSDRRTEFPLHFAESHNSRSSPMRPRSSSHRSTSRVARASRCAAWLATKWRQVPGWQSPRIAFGASFARSAESRLAQHEAAEILTPIWRGDLEWPDMGWRSRAPASASKSQLSFV